MWYYLPSHWPQRTGSPRLIARAPQLKSFNQKALVSALENGLDEED